MQIGANARIVYDDGKQRASLQQAIALLAVMAVDHFLIRFQDFFKLLVDRLCIKKLFTRLDNLNEQ